MLVAAQRRLLHLRLVNGGQLGDGRLGPPVCIVFEGWDAAGKGGAIKRLIARLDPRHVRVTQFGPPTPDELRHHFLWRFFPTLPGWGGMAVLDRSWYGRVLVERVENLASEVQWRRAYDEISSVERSLAAEGMILIKLWLHISHDEQLKRFKARQEDPLKAWKLTDEDWRNREKRAAVRGRGRGHAEPDRSPLRTLGRDPRRAEALRASRRTREGHRPDGGGDASLGHRPTCLQRRRLRPRNLTQHPHGGPWAIERGPFRAGQRRDGDRSPPTRCAREPGEGPARHAAWPGSANRAT